MRKPLIIGHSYNPNAQSPVEALDPRVLNSSGHRLWQISGLSLEQFIESFKRINTSPTGPLMKKEMRAWASTLVYSGLFDNRRVLIVGAENARYYPWPEKMPPPMTWQRWRATRSHVAWIPHTSGLTRFWNDQANREALAELVAAMLPGDVPA